MSYASIVAMAQSTSLVNRCAAAAADEGIQSNPDPITWTAQRIWQIVAEDSGWVEAWDYAVNGATADVNPDTGARPGVINDDMILAVVQPMVQAFLHGSGEDDEPVP
jgi:hypothetical protein